MDTHSTRVQDLRGLYLKNGVDIGLYSEGIGGFTLEQACSSRTAGRTAPAGYTPVHTTPPGHTPTARAVEAHNALCSR